LGESGRSRKFVGRTTKAEGGSGHDGSDDEVGASTRQLHYVMLLLLLVGKGEERRSSKRAAYL